MGYNQILVGMHNDATDGYDQMLDGKIFKANPQMAFYSVAGSDELAIQSAVVLNAAGQVLARVNNGTKMVLEVPAGDYASGIYPAVVTLKNGQSQAIKILVP